LVEWLVRIPPEIRARAYQSDRELAWSREDAIQVVEALRAHFAVIGMEIWLPTTSGPTIPSPFIYHWAPTGEQCTTAAAEFIRNFRWDEADVDHHDSEPYFNFTVVPLAS
jgi:hypothetical protein